VAETVTKPSPVKQRSQPVGTATACILSGAGFMKRYGVRSSVRLFVHLPSIWANSSKPAAAGLLLWARRAGDIDRLWQQWRAADECGQCYVVSVRR